MGFRYGSVIVARLLRLIGSDGRRIIGTTSGGAPRIDFYTGLDSEVSPGTVTVVGVPGAVDVGWINLESPELDAVAGPTNMLLLAREDGTREIVVGADAISLDSVGDFALQMIGGGGLVLDGQAGGADMRLLGPGGQSIELPEANAGVTIGAASRPILGIDSGVTAVTTDASGQDTIAHSLGVQPDFVGVHRFSNQWPVLISRNATDFTVELRQNANPGTAVAGGTNGTVMWLAIAFV